MVVVIISKRTFGLIDYNTIRTLGSSLHAQFANMRIGGAASLANRNHGSRGAAGGTNNATGHMKQRSRLRSDSETLSDDILLESNDEGIETDHLDDRIEELAIMEVVVADAPKTISHQPPADQSRCKIDLAVSMQQLQLPTISVQVSETDTSKAVSPVSSRSESPLR